MIKEIKYLVYNLVIKIESQNLTIESELLSIARIFSKIKKVRKYWKIFNFWKVVNEAIQKVKGQKNKTTEEIERQKALQKTVYEEINNIRLLLTTILLEIKQFKEKPQQLIAPNSEDQLLVLTIGRIISYMKKVLIYL